MAAAVKFIRPFIVAGGQIYRPGERAALADDDARQAIEQEAAVRIAAPDKPPAHKMMERGSIKSGRR
jgi:hypothetical protein